jgi:hypothetical protein
MNNVLKVNFSRRKKLTSVLGLSLDGSRLEGVVLRRTNGALQLQQTFSVTLSLDPLTATPELIGREIRNHLDAVGVRERHCVVGVPLKWVLTAHTELPKLADEDAASLLQLEAERGFPSDPASLRLSYSSCPLPGGKQLVMMAGISNSQLATLEQVLSAAKLKPVSFALGLAALQPPGEEASNGVLALAVGESQVSLQITCGGGVAALRALEGAIENEAGRRELNTEFVAREARITLGQLPAGLRETVKRVRIFGPRELAQELADEMELRFEPMGLSVEVVAAYAPNEFGVTLPPEASLSAAFSLAARRLAGQWPAFEFLPPKPTAWQQINKKYSSGKLRSVGAIAAGVVLIVGGLFAYQQFQLMRLNSQWSAMSAKVHELESLQAQIRQYRPWFDDSFRSLSIFKQVTAAFPETGEVTAKTVEIRDGTVVSCSGNALNNPALLGMLARLRAADSVTDLKVDSIRGKTPMQFTFDFHWNNGGGHEN